MWRTLPNTARTLRATEARLERIYSAAYHGLKGDRLAVAAGMLPSEYRQLRQFDPMVEMAELKGAADAELALSTKMLEAANAGDAKAALAVLQHRHDWTAKKELSIDVQQQISITDALKEAQGRVLEGSAAPRSSLPNHSPAVLVANLVARDQPSLTHADYADHAEADL